MTTRPSIVSSTRPKNFFTYRVSDQVYACLKIFLTPCYPSQLDPPKFAFSVVSVTLSWSLPKPKMATLKRERDSSPNGTAPDRSTRRRLGENSICDVHASCLSTRSIIDHVGDLTLIVGNTTCKEGATEPTPDNKKPVSFVVSAKILCQASSVFKKVLFGGLAEMQTPSNSAEWIVRLPKDNPKAMSILLNIMHLHFEKVFPIDEVTFEAVYNITVLTAKYDIDHLLRPWASLWMNALRKRKGINYVNRQRRLWIAWRLGHLVSFEEGLADIMYRCYLDVSIKDSASYEMCFYTLEPAGAASKSILVIMHQPY
jgi:hypothetical protein